MYLFNFSSFAKYVNKLEFAILFKRSASKQVTTTNTYDIIASLVFFFFLLFKYLKESLRYFPHISPSAIYIAINKLNITIKSNSLIPLIFNIHIAIEKPNIVVIRGLSKIILPKIPSKNNSGIIFIYVGPKQLAKTTTIIHNI